MPTGVYIRTKEQKEKIRQSMIGKNTRKKTKKERENMSKARKGLYMREESSQWKGDKIETKNAVHWRVEAKYGKPNYCEICKRTDKKKYEWSNKDHSYRMPINKDDWQRLCTSCHRKYDIKHNNYRKKNENA